MGARDVLVLVVILFISALVFFPLYLIFDNIHDALVLNPEIASSAPTVEALGGIERVIGRLDYMVFGLFIGYTLAVLITGWLVGGQPIFMIAYFIMIVMAVIVGAILSNVWEAFSESPELVATLPNFVLTNNLMTYLPVYASIVGFLGVVVMYGKPYLRGGGR